MLMLIIVKNAFVLLLYIIAVCFTALLFRDGRGRADGRVRIILLKYKYKRRRLRRVYSDR